MLIFMPFQQFLYVFYTVYCNPSPCLFDTKCLNQCRHYMAEILPIRRKTLYNQSINQSINWTGFTEYTCIRNSNLSQNFSPSVAVIWPKYWWYGIKHYIINQSNNQSNNWTGFTEYTCISNNSSSIKMNSKLSQNNEHMHVLYYM